MTLSQALAVIAARRRSGLAAVPLVVAIGTLTAQKEYMVSVSVLLDVKSSDPVTGTVLIGMTAPSYLTTQRDLIQSERVARC
jgi:succinoglycan biosynthesis transport protein ExoP